MIFEHFLLTRFNVRFDWTKKKWDETSLRNRIEIFENICLSSVKSQTNKNFRWIVYFDPSSPDFLKKKVEQYQRQLNIFEPIYKENFNSAEVRNDILSRLDSKTEYIITTRLDNDDAISKNYIDLIQKCFDHQEIEIINFLYGYRLCKNKLYLNKFSPNNFSSIIEKIQPSSEKKIVTVYCGIPHTEYNKIGPVKDILEYRPWIVNIHKDNISNIRQGVRHPMKTIKQDFEINLPALQKKENLTLCYLEKIINIILNPTLAFLKIFLRPIGVMTLYNKIMKKS